MDLTTWKHSGIARAAARLCVAAALIMTTGKTAAAQSIAAAAESGLVGTWAVDITLRDCATNAPLGPPFHSLVTFHRGGTLSETTASLAFAIGQRTPGHGTWARKGGHTYAQEMIALVLFDTAPNLPGTPGFDPTKPVSPGFFAGWVTVSHTVSLVDADHITSAGTNAFYKNSGELYRSGCSTAVGQRFE
jgi:hypothetical protein